MQSFLLVGDLSIVYDGRAFSTLKTGKYMVMYKPDGSLSIHNKTSIKPVNYQNKRSTLELLVGDEYDDADLNYFNNPG